MKPHLIAGAALAAALLWPAVSTAQVMYYSTPFASQSRSLYAVPFGDFDDDDVIPIRFANANATDTVRVRFTAVEPRSANTETASPQSLATVVSDVRAVLDLIAAINGTFRPEPRPTPGTCNDDRLRALEAAIAGNPNYKAPACLTSGGGDANGVDGNFAALATPPGVARAAAVPFSAATGEKVGCDVSALAAEVEAAKEEIRLLNEAVLGKSVPVSPKREGGLLQVVDALHEKQKKTGERLDQMAEEQEKKYEEILRQLKDLSDRLPPTGGGA